MAPTKMSQFDATINCSLRKYAYHRYFQRKQNLYIEIEKLDYSIIYIFIEGIIRK